MGETGPAPLGKANCGEYTGGWWWVPRPTGVSHRPGGSRRDGAEEGLLVPPLRRWEVMGRPGSNLFPRRKSKNKHYDMRGPKAGRGESGAALRGTASPPQNPLEPLAGLPVGIPGRLPAPLPGPIKCESSAQQLHRNPCCVR